MTSEQIALEYVWEHFKKTRGQWPAKADVARHLYQAQKAKLEDALRGSKAIGIRLGGDEPVEARLEGLRRLPEVQALLNPIPRVLQFGSDRFLADPKADNGTDRPTILESEITPFWPAPEDAALALLLLEKVSTPWSIHTGGHNGRERVITVGLSWLLFHGAGTLEDLDAREAGFTPAPFGREPSPRGRLVLERIFSEAMRDGQWPESVPFAVRNRDLGYVPTLVNELPQGLVWDRFVPSTSSSLRLNARALRWIQGSGAATSLLFRIVRELTTLWLEGQANISLSRVAERLNEPLSKLRGPVLFLERDPWCWITSYGEYGGDWEFQPTEATVENDALKGWEEYDAFWEEKRSDASQYAGAGWGLTDEYIRQIQARSEAPPALKLDWSIPDVRVLRLLGEGANGQVYEAAGDAAQGRIAVKVLQPSQFADQDEARDRFEREIRALEGTSHPNLVKFRSHGKTGGEQRHYLVMEMVEGVELKQWAQGQTPEAVARAMRGVADGLTYLHERGTFHRDIKPSNVIVRSSGEACIVDLGLAYLVGASLTTLTARELGTPGYVPEEVWKDPQTSRDARHDVYSCGVVLYELLAGKRPPARYEPLANLDPALRYLDGLISASIAPHEQRLRSMRDFAGHLSRWLDGDRAVAFDPALLPRRQDQLDWSMGPEALAKAIPRELELQQPLALFHLVGTAANSVRRAMDFDDRERRIALVLDGMFSVLRVAVELDHEELLQRADAACSEIHRLALDADGRRRETLPCSAEWLWRELDLRILAAGAYAIRRSARRALVMIARARIGGSPPQFSPRAESLSALNPDRVTSDEMARSLEDFLAHR